MNTQDNDWKDVLFKIYHPTLSFTAALLGHIYTMIQ
jgi:hypothetical protein